MNQIFFLSFGNYRVDYVIMTDVFCVNLWVWYKKELIMTNIVEFNGRPFHFIGIGGIGMSALAYVLAKRNLPVSGSDLRSTHITQRLQSVGAYIFNHQEEGNIKFFQEKNNHKLPQIADRFQILPQVICSTAINQANSEYKAAVELGCPIFHRSDLLSALIDQYSQSIAVGGTHGKTTTSSLIGHILLQTDLDPTIIVGGEVNTWGGNARLGKAEYLVAEADESDGSLIKFKSTIGIITNIELDHPDHYQDLESVINTFKTFAHRCEVLIGCIDDRTVKENFQPTITYSLDKNSGADYTVDEVNYAAHGTTCRIWEKGQILGELNLNLLGKHNLSNALAAIAVGRYIGLEFKDIAQACSTFGGAKRRFELKGQENGIYFVDDYAHHPSEIQVTLAAGRLQVKSNQRLVAIFQPHRYSRTEVFMQDFAKSFKDADTVIITDVYSAGEEKREHITGEHLANLIRNNNHTQVYYQSSLSDVVKFLKEYLKPGDLALFLGAGNLNGIIPDLVSFFQKPTVELAGTKN